MRGEEYGKTPGTILNINKKNMKYQILCTCKSCGATAYQFTNKKDVPEKDRIFECNKCTTKRWDKGKNKPTSKQLVFNSS